ncbi:MAG TPA: hypothetical protein DEP66_01430 [Acidimicrobiaceae bacterium]|nr:hypothetical protein [Acidimicrobiaceae bacterium]HCB36901.1 hypothetical protein [Acidimicrobiaceae bacterium]
MSTHAGHGAHSSTGYEMPIRLNEQTTVYAWCPNTLADRVITVAVPVTCEEAVRHIQRLEESTRTTPDDAALMFLRTEGFSSSLIEDIEAPLDQLLLLTPAAETQTKEVAVGATLTVANATALDLMVADASGGEALSVEMLHGWHKVLLRDDPNIGRGLGCLRDRRAASGSSDLRSAKHIYAPPENVPHLVRDLCAFVNDSRMNPVLLAALAHVQFESIHPYGDGNGRIGRMLVGWILARRLGLNRIPPVSSAIALDRPAYIAALEKYREGAVDEWVLWFAEKVIRSVEIGETIAQKLQIMLDDWQQAIGKLRKGSAASRLPSVLVRQPIISIGRVVDALGVSERAATNALRQFADAGIIEPYEMDRRTTTEKARYWWMAPAVVAILRDVSKSHVSGGRTAAPPSTLAAGERPDRG